MRRVMLLALLVTSGCQSVYVGIGMHAEKWDAPEYYSPNPVGMVGAEADFGHEITGFCEHLSSIPYYEVGLGFNWCGVQKRFNLR